MRFNKILFAVIVGALWANDVYAATCNFSCGDGQGTPPASCGSSASNHCSVWPQNTCTPPSGYVFAGWLFKSYVVQPGISDAYLNTCSNSSITVTYTVTAQYTLDTGGGSPSTVTSKSYVDRLGRLKQGVLPAYGSDYAMIYNQNTIGMRPISQNIVQGSGALPTTGAVVNALADKQAAMNGTSGYAVTYRNTSSGVGSRAVYNGGTYNSNALSKIEHVNAAVVNAFNAHVTCAEYATPGDSSTECILWNVNQLSGTYVP